MSNKFCGCWTSNRRTLQRYLPQVLLHSHTKILTTISKTVLKQTFINNDNEKLDEVHYTFPLYDGITVVAFKCTIASKTITGVVKEKQQARKEYSEAIAKGETAGLLEQLPEASDVFTTKIGNVPAHEKIYVEIVYVGELKHDAETNGTRFSIPIQIAPRYGPVSHDSASTIGKSNADDGKGIQILVDVELEKGAIIKSIQSPSHPIAVTVGRTSSMPDDAFDGNHGSATLTLGSTELDKDFVLIVLGTGQESPRALLETHPNIPNHRALMVTLVPKFNIPNIIPEIVFIVDRSGSMDGKISTVVAAMKIFLKSLPNNGVKFNICSFGSRYSFLFEKSRTYDQSSLNEALQHLETFRADHGGTEMLNPIKATIENRFSDMPLEVLLLTDGEIWNQDALFDYVNQQKNARFFTLGIGHGASSALVEGIARAGDGFAQFVSDNEKMDMKIVRMLKGALTPHVLDYSLEVHYDKKGKSDTSDDDFEIIESFKDSANVVVTDVETPEIKEKISLFNEAATEEPTNAPGDRYEGLPKIEIPAILQAPQKIPSLYPFVRTTVYLLMSPAACQTAPKSVVLKGTSDHGPLELEIPVQDVGRGETIHQLAAKKAVKELENGRGWITEIQVAGQSLKSKYPGRWNLLVEREAVRLGVQFQVGGKWCSFIAMEEEDGEASRMTMTVRNDRSPRLRRLRSIMLRTAGKRSTGIARQSVASEKLRVVEYEMSLKEEPVCMSLSGNESGGRFDRDFERGVTLSSPEAGASTFDNGAQASTLDLAHEQSLQTFASNDERMRKLIEMQEFDGSWRKSEILWNLLSLNNSQVDIEEVLGTQCEQTIATVLAIAWLQKKMAQEEGIWEMVVEKAVSWMKTNGIDDRDAQTLVNKAKALFDV